MRYLLCGYYGYRNLGDDLMLEVIINRIVLADKDNKIYVKCKDASGFDQATLNKVEPVCLDGILVKNGIRALNWLIYLSKITRLLTRVDILVIGGGGLFIDKGKHNGSLFTLFLISIFSRIFRKKVYITGVGIDLLRHPTSRFYLKWILKCADSICIRENYGYRLAKSLIGEPGSRLFLTKDILYCSAYIGSGFIPARNRNIGISLTDYYLEYDPSKDKRDNFVREFSRFLKNSAAPDRTVKLFIFQDKESGSDRKIAEDILRASVKSALNYEIIDLRAADDLKEAYRDLGMVIGMRFHALVFSSIFNIPFIGLNHEKKIEEVCSDFDMPYIDIDNLSADNLSRQVSNLFTSGKIPEVTRDMVARAEQNFDFMRKG
jgi:polysaccharide pyruvyl transferase WcaK-like protein